MTFRIMVHPLLFVVGGILAAEVYRRYATDDEKVRWENYIKSHHGEWGILGLVLGAATGHYGIAATGLGLALHDVNDADKWFSGNKTETV